MNYKAFNRFIEISSVKEGFEFIDMLQACLQYDAHEVALCFGLEAEYDYDSEDEEEEEYTYNNPEVMIGKWYINLQEDFDRCGDVHTRMFMKIPDSFEPVTPITQRMNELEAQIVEVEDDLNKLERLYGQHSRKPSDVEEFKKKVEEIDKGRNILKMVSKIQKKQDILCGDINPYMNYEGINPHE